MYRHLNTEFEIDRITEKLDFVLTSLWPWNKLNRPKNTIMQSLKVVDLWQIYASNDWCVIVWVIICESVLTGYQLVYEQTLVISVISSVTPTCFNLRLICYDLVNNT